MKLRRPISFVLLTTTALLAPAVVPAQTLDQYGGYAGLSIPGGATGHFRVAKLNNRWMFATPAGNAFWMLGVYNVDVDEHVTDLGRTYKQVVIAKYGDADLTWGPQQNRRLKAWGFNTLGEYANKWTVPWTTINDPRWPGGVQPVQVPTISFPLQGASYSLRNLNGYANGPVKELYWALDGHFTGHRGHFPDVFDPNFDQWVNGCASAQVGNSPWLLGVSSDDTDYLTGFGPGPDFDSGGHAHPHLGFVALLSPPTQMQNPSLNITYTDTKVYTKHALRTFLAAKYGNIGALNTAWGSTYTTFDSNGSWPNGSGLLDENGKGTWVGTDSVSLGNAAPAVKADLDSFLYNIAVQYFSIYRTRIKQRTPNALYLGPTTVGAWNAPARRQILKAAGENVDVLRTTWDGNQAKLEFIAQHAGDIPIATWEGSFANPDSALFRHPARWFSSQAERGAHYQKVLAGHLDARVRSSGVRPIVGIQWWEFHDNFGEKLNWGLISLSDNAYDGREARVAPGRDAWRFQVGGEEREHGDFISYVRQANYNVTERLRRELGGGPTSNDASSTMGKK